VKYLILIFSFLPILSFGQNEPQRFISVRGESEINITPDRIELTITYSETENIRKENELQQKEAELIKLLKTFSIDLKKLTIDNFAANKIMHDHTTFCIVHRAELLYLKLLRFLQCRVKLHAPYRKVQIPVTTHLKK
jgi:hypothetical protein